LDKRDLHYNHHHHEQQQQEIEQQNEKEGASVDLDSTGLLRGLFGAEREEFHSRTVIYFVGSNKIE
jgi:hypothetical protein